MADSTEYQLVYRSSIYDVYNKQKIALHTQTKEPQTNSIWILFLFCSPVEKKYLASSSRNVSPGDMKLVYILD